MVTAFIHGFCLAIGLILPLGMQNIFVFQQGIAQPCFKSVLPAVIAAAVCDTLLILLAVSGVSAVLLHFSLLRQVIWLVGLGMLVYIGWVNWTGRGASMPGENPVCFSTRRQIAFAVSVSLLNPAAFLDILGVIGVSSMQYEPEAKWCFSLAAILVSWGWFCMLAVLGGKIASVGELNRQQAKINKISALAVWGSAVYMAGTFF